MANVVVPYGSPMNPLLHPPELTACECEVLQLLCDGHNCPEISRIRDVSLSTVQTQCEAIKQKLGCHTNARAVAIGLHFNLIAVRWVEE